MEVTIKELESKGFALAREDGEKMGEMSYSLAGSDKLIIDHTEVEEASQGKGVGMKMLMAIVEMARREDRKIIPLCPFAKAMFRKTEEIRDVL